MDERWITALADYPVSQTLDDTGEDKEARNALDAIAGQRASALRNNPLMDPRCLRNAALSIALARSSPCDIDSFYIIRFLSSIQPLPLPSLFHVESRLRKNKFRLFERDRGIEFIFFLRMEYARLKYLRNDPRWRGEKVRSNRMENICTFKILKFTRHSGKRIFDRTHVTMRNFFFFCLLFFCKKKRVVGFFEM